MVIYFKTISISLQGEIKLLDENLVYRFIDEMADVNFEEEKSKLINTSIKKSSNNKIAFVL